MIPKEKLQQTKKKIEGAQRPLFIFDGDCDGICAYIILKTLNSNARAVMIKGDPVVDTRFLDFVYDLQPDLIIILDAGNVAQEFIDRAQRPIIWIDHHTLQDRQNIEYLNPQLWDKNNRLSTSYWAYQIAQQKGWLAVTGIVADWALPPNLEEIQKRFPGYVDDVTSAAQALHETKAGEMVDIIDFNLKGNDVKPMQVIKALEKIELPKEIFEQTTPEGKWIFKRAQKHMQEFKALLESAQGCYDKEDPILLFRYTEYQTSFTRQIANALLYKFPEKFVIIARKKDHEMKMSLRSSDKLNVDIPAMLTDIFEQIPGRGGGHKYACGSVVQEQFFEDFLQKVRSHLQ